MNGLEDIIHQNAQAIAGAIERTLGVDGDGAWLTPAEAMRLMCCPVESERTRRRRFESLRSLPNVRRRIVGNVLCVDAGDWLGLMRHARRLSNRNDDFSEGLEILLGSGSAPVGQYSQDPPVKPSVRAAAVTTAPARRPEVVGSPASKRKVSV